MGQMIDSPFGQAPTMYDNDPRAQQLYKEMFAQAHMAPGMGIGTHTYAPDAGFQREMVRRRAQGASAQERMAALSRAGVTDRDGMQQVFSRLYAPISQAFMRARR